MKIIKRIIIAFSLICIITGGIAVYAVHIEPHVLVEKKYNLMEKMDSQNGLTVVQLSDIEISKDYTERELSAMVKKVNARKPDIVVFTGDLFSNYARYRPVESVTAALRELKAVYGKYAIWGNNDYGGGAVRVYETIMKEAGFQVLKNEGVNMETSDGSRVFIGGLDDALLGHPDIDKTMQMADERVGYQILLCHEPNLVERIGDYPVDLVLAGHTHGGQVAFANEIFGSDSQYMKGFYEIDNPQKTRLYVNSGMGTSRISVRLLTPPQIATFQIGFTNKE